MAKSIEDIANVAKLSGYLSITTESGNVIAEKVSAKDYPNLSETLTEYSKKSPLKISIFKKHLNKYNLLNDEPFLIAKTETEPTPNPQKKTAMISDKPSGNSEQYIWQNMLNEKQKEVNKLERVYDKLVDRYEESQTQRGQLQATINELTVKINTAEKEKELALLTANATNKQSLNGFVTDALKPETLTGIAAVFSAIKNGTMPATSSNSMVSDLTQQKKDSLVAFKDVLVKLTDKEAIKLAVIVANLSKDPEDIEEAFSKLNLDNLTEQ
ncbi:MAG: hypothetical protein PSX81_02725 [bacterium]|nr:hypothetical protein [bacterium]